MPTAGHQRAPARGVRAAKIGDCAGPRTAVTSSGRVGAAVTRPALTATKSVGGGVEAGNTAAVPSSKPVAARTAGASLAT